MSARYSQRANILAGGFLLGGVMLAVVTSFVLADVSFTPMSEYLVRFSLRDGATGLAPDSAVRVGGQQVGKVKSISLERDAAGEHVIDVRIKIRSDIELYEDAWAYLEVPLLGTGSTINIPYLGSGEGIDPPQNGSSRLAEGGVLVGSIAPPAFLANAGFGPEQREQLQRMFTESERMLAEIAAAVEAVRPKIEPAADDIMASIASAKRTIQSVETDIETWRSNITATLDNAERASEKFPVMVDDARVVVADAGEMIRTGRAIVDENRPRIRNILTDTETTIAGVKNDWVPQGTNLLSTATDGVEAYTSLGRRADAMLLEEQPGIERTLANLRVMSDQLKFLAIEARSQPWRLLHRPDTKELETQLLYDSARSYAVAVGDLRAASESLEAILTGAKLSGDVDLDRLQAMRAELQQAFETYADAERDLLNRMIEENR